MNYSKEELNEAYKKLPEELKEVFLSVDVTDSINAIGKKYNLHIDQIGNLDSEAGYVLLGLSHPTEFVSSLTNRLGIDRVVASQVASEINDQVFLKIRGLLKDVQDKKKKGATEEVEPQPSKDALLAALEHPEGMLKKPAPATDIPLVEIKNAYALPKPQMGRDIPVVAQVPPTVEVSEDSTSTLRLNLEKPDILTQKLSGEVSLPKVDTRVEATPAKKIDPYKEAV